MERRLVEMVSEALECIQSGYCALNDLTIRCQRTSENAPSLTIRIYKGASEYMYDEFVVEIKYRGDKYVRHFHEKNYKRRGWYMAYRFFRFIADTLEDLGCEDRMLTSMGWHWDLSTMREIEHYMDAYHRALMLDDIEPVDIMKFEEPEGEEDNESN